MSKDFVQYYIVEVTEVSENIQANGLRLALNPRMPRQLLKTVLEIEVNKNPTKYIAQLVEESK